ncbi:MAG: 4-hydroxy-tetrahydrodipicolinate reductase [Synergistaceae bacterium]|nr:4-hydroxy-tetrahydrodipicolinate reductase [Synergistaceae bacterium]
MKYGIVGASGRMGQEVVRLFGQEGHELTLTSDLAGIERKGTLDVLVDFSSYTALPGTVELCKTHGTALVIGTTALKEEHFALLRDLGKEVAVVQSYNFAMGVNVLKMILRDYAPLLSDWDLEIEETHHNKKKDAPSGTAIFLRDATGRNCPTHSLRLGGVPGDHSVRFANDGEVLTFTHRALARNVFALGALRAALFVAEAEKGFYTFEDVLKKTRKTEERT